jgi:TM2 domain-containing membrane protein YozV
MYCSNCGAENADSAKFCQKCGSPLAVAPQPQAAAAAEAAAPPPPAADPRVRGGYSPGYPPAVAVEKRYATGKSPGVALILSALIVGLGQFYNGDVKKGLIMLLSAIILGLMTFGIAWFGVACWSAIDAYQVASGKAPLW